MRTSRLLSPLQDIRVSYRPNATLCWPVLKCRPCSCIAPLELSTTKPLNAFALPWDRLRKAKGKNVKDRNAKDDPASDHRAIGTAQSLFTSHPSSPGAPFFQPDGAHIFQKLVSFLRAQYPHFGFREVLTPTMYKKTLWEQSGHWENYKDDMFTITGKVSKISHGGASEPEDLNVQRKKNIEDAPESEEYGLKPMNCPGHCLLYQAERRSYRDLPIRYAEFSALHRDEISGALSGLTRVRRFHQDDGHIFCRPSQITQEIDRSLAFIRIVYETIGLPNYRFVLSTRPAKDYIGSVTEWDSAENQLKAALDGKENFGVKWETRKGEGAFYGPKIDVILQDSNGKEHQTGTIQLDFQLPKRFELEYDSPAAEMEGKGENWESSETRAILGKATPVMIHRAVVGSVERIMALLLENCRGRLPFWLSPKQVIILTVGNKEHIKDYARTAKTFISSQGEDLVQQSKRLPYTMDPPPCMVDIDDSGDSIAQKLVRAKKKKYNLICVVGEKNLAKVPLKSPATMDLDVAGQMDQRKTWDLIETIQPGSQAPMQKDKGTGAAYRGLLGVNVRLNLIQCRHFIKQLNDNYH